MDIRPLQSYSREERDRLEGTGYESPKKYRVAKEATELTTTIRVELIDLDEPYRKQWEADPDELLSYDKMIRQGCSLGCYVNDELVGAAIAEPQHWNHTLWLHNFQVSDKHRRSGIGTELMNRLADVARQHKFRAVVLETQNTNFPAIQFYKHCGFELEGIDLSLYTNSDMVDGEVAFFMKKKL
ncbi:GNAT family N-acetyltransferase [Paenibacillus sp. NPDC056579]|uniref:GNAT family N-acetyltransferase n=1 Tax=Paenibacillus sp. NPDC056579 TaxID=3345871 RepID=UPI00368567AA